MTVLSWFQKSGFGGRTTTGFYLSEHRAQEALLGAKGDVEQALEWLLNRSEDAPTEHTSDDARMDDGEVGPRSQPSKRRFGTVRTW